MSGAADGVSGPQPAASGGPVAVASPAPPLDLSSTENCLLSLRDAVGRTAVLLYFFADSADPAARADLSALPGLPLSGPRLLRGVSPEPLSDLGRLQRELRLPFPLLHDDRGQAAAFGFDAAAVPRLLVLIDRHRRLAWRAAVRQGLAPLLPELTTAWGTLAPPTARLPRRLVQRGKARRTRNLEPDGHRRR